MFAVFYKYEIGAALTLAASPVTDEQLLDALRLSLIPGIGPRTQQVLLERFGSPREILAAPPDMLRAVPGVGPKIAGAVFESRGDTVAEELVERCRQQAISLMIPGRDDYPRMLSEIPDLPAVLYCRGGFEQRDSLAVALVGSRRCSHYGRQQTEKLAGGLARAGMTIVSGLARGIDGHAHRAAMTAGGRTIAVLATGVDEIYPPEHVELANEVAAAGAVVSESSLGQKPLAGLFPQRNRIISGLSLGVIVVEASRKSGALHTARHAMEQGREVFAVPGRIDSPDSQGCHDLIRDGAKLVTCADDVLEELGPLTEPVEVPITQANNHPAAATEPPQAVHSPRELSLSDQERRILNLVPQDPVHIDQILQQADIETSRVLSTLTVLEMKRMVRRFPGSNYCRC